MNKEQLDHFKQLLDDSYSEIGSATCVQAVADEKAAIVTNMAAEILELAKELNKILEASAEMTPVVIALHYLNTQPSEGNKP